ncbi:hypothetical protein CCACVL1_31036, partial [Corchorus capsularis]
MDENGDGYISRDEFVTFLRELGNTKLVNSTVFWQLDEMGIEPAGSSSSELALVPKPKKKS